MTLSIDDPVRFEKIMATALPALRAFMEDGAQDPVIQDRCYFMGNLGYPAICQGGWYRQGERTV